MGDDHECKQEGRLATVETHQEYILESLQRLEKGIFGNGQRGLRGEVDDTNHRLENVEAAVTLRGKSRGKWDKRFWMIVMVVLMQAAIGLRVWIGG